MSKKQPEEEKNEQAEVTEMPTAEKEETAEELVKNEAEVLKQQLAELNDKHLRMLAEYDNFRRRSKTERENIYADVRGDTVKKILPVYDSVLRAAQQETDPEAKKGAEAILNQFKSVLEGMGVREIEAVGKKFDPTLHDAILHVDDEKYGEGEIVLELTKGFMLGDKVIRFSAVQVAN